MDLARDGTLRFFGARREKGLAEKGPQSPSLEFTQETRISHETHRHHDVARMHERALLSTPHVDVFRSSDDNLRRASVHNSESHDVRFRDLPSLPKSRLAHYAILVDFDAHSSGLEKSHCVDTSVDDERRQNQNNRMHHDSPDDKQSEKTGREDHGSLVPEITWFDDGDGRHALF